MTEQTEWELIDEPATGARQSPGFRPGSSRASASDAQQEAQPGGDASDRAGPSFHSYSSESLNSRAGMARAMLGPRWKFKVAGMAAIGIIAVVLVAMLTGIVLLAVTGFALLSLIVAKLRRMMSGERPGAASHAPAHWNDMR